MDKIDEYGKEHLVTHLIRAKRWPKLAELAFEQPDFPGARQAVEQIVNQYGVITELTEVIIQFALEHGYTLKNHREFGLLIHEFQLAKAKVEGETHD